MVETLYIVLRNWSFKIFPTIVKWSKILGISDFESHKKLVPRMSLIDHNWLIRKKVCILGKN